MSFLPGKFPVGGFILTLLLASEPLHAQQRLEWRDDWRRVGAAEYVAIGVMGGGALVISEWVAPAQEPTWTRPIFIDWEARNWLRWDTASSRDLAAVASDVLIATSMLQPLVVDTLFVAGLLDKNADVVHQMGVVSLHAYALTKLLNISAKRLFARQRPYVTGCQEDPDYSNLCDNYDRYRSYYSGHAAVAATGAGLVCSHHTHLPLYGGGAVDSFACGAALGVALTTGALRIIADRHWATDVITGYLVGFSTGYLLPTLLYYGSFRSAPVPEQTGTEQVAIRQRLPPQLSFSGRF